MDLKTLRHRVLQQLIVDKWDNPQLVEALARIEREMIGAVVSRRRALDEGDDDYSARVPCPKKPRPILNRSAAAMPLE